MAEVSTSPHRLYVSNFAFDLTEDDVKALFSKHGKVVACDVVKDRRDETRSRGFGFVTMSSAKECDAAIAALHGHTVKDRDLSVAMAHTPAEVEEKRAAKRTERNAAKKARKKDKAAVAAASGEGGAAPKARRERKKRPRRTTLAMEKKRAERLAKENQELKAKLAALEK